MWHRHDLKLFKMYYDMDNPCLFSRYAAESSAITATLCDNFHMSQSWFSYFYLFISACVGLQKMPIDPVRTRRLN